MRILLGDDHALLLAGLRSLLESSHDIVGSVSNGRDLVTSASHFKPDIIITDISMPELNGLEAAKQIKSRLPSTKLIFLSMQTNPIYLRKALEVGADAYVLKAGAVEELAQAIHQVLSGRTYVSPGFGCDVIESLWNHSGKPVKEGTSLTERQLEILQLMAEGRLSKQIADILGVSIKTVEFHRARILARLGAHSTAEVIRIAVEQRLIPPLFSIIG